MCWVFEGTVRGLLWLEGDSEGERRRSFRQGGDGQIVLARCALGMTWAFALKWKPRTEVLTQMFIDTLWSL